MLKVENRFNRDGVFSKKIRAGRRRTYFFDVRTTRSNDYYITITESKKRYDDDSYERHKLHIYKEDFNKFILGLEQTIDHVKTELMPEYDFDEYTRDPEDYNPNYHNKKEDSVAVETVEEKGDDTEEVESPTVINEDEDDDLKWD